MTVDGTAVTWGALLERWSLIECDLHAEYGIDLDEPGLLQQRRWRWLRTRILGLLARDSSISRALTPDDRKHSGGEPWR
ncbi:hypothetical protein ACIBH1_45090 [Nonomuraea sp. NPDC050663]|uniref:hypothetical protein n=1 Tax=Nonomuraea sp. NPDC050663 TaxID=3364370 RepID=UPI0037AAD3D8